LSYAGKTRPRHLSPWVSPLPLLLKQGEFGTSPDVCGESRLSGIASRLTRLSFTENMFPNTFATGQTSPQKGFIFRRTLKVFSL
jgi:hypothetical protein